MDTCISKVGVATDFWKVAGETEMVLFGSVQFSQTAFRSHKGNRRQTSMRYNRKTYQYITIVAIRVPLLWRIPVQSLFHKKRRHIMDCNNEKKTTHHGLQ